MCLQQRVPYQRSDNGIKETEPAPRPNFLTQMYEYCLCPNCQWSIKEVADIYPMSIAMLSNSGIKH